MLVGHRVARGEDARVGHITWAFYYMTEKALLLLVEDEPITLLVTQDALEAGGFSVTTAVTGAEAIALVEDRIAEIAGLITDVQLGEGPTGWDVARRARDLKPRLPIVYATADGAQGWAAHGVENSIIVQKPYRLEKLLDLIPSLINKSKSIGE